MQNFKCSLPALTISSFLSLLILLKFQFCNLENAVHSGDPIRSNALFPNTMSIALSLFSFLVKSHGVPSSGSFSVKSNDNPEAIPRALAMLFTLGGEYTSIIGSLIPSLSSAFVISSIPSFQLLLFFAFSTLSLILMIESLTP